MFLVNKKFFEATKDKFFYGWVIVGIGSLGIFTSGAGQSHTFSPFIPVISQDLKISSTSITTAYMIATLFAAFLLPKMGKLVDKYGPRKILIYTVLLLGNWLYDFWSCIKLSNVGHRIWIFKIFWARLSNAWFGKYYNSVV